MKKILIVEDDKKISNLIKLYCDKAGFESLLATNTQEASKLLAQKSPNLIILDLMLPGTEEETGLAFIKQIRQKSQTPIIIVSAQDEEVDRVVGLELGADDYVTKPFSPKELIARIKAVLRRSQQTSNSNNDTIIIGSFEINPEKHEVKQNHQEISLTKTEFMLLSILAQTPGKVFSREQLIEHLYPDSQADIYDRTIDVHIANLRKKINDKYQSLIITVKGLGYKINDNQDET